jgi:hypothetical protein
MKVLKLLLFLCIAGFIGLVGYAYLGDLAPDRQQVNIPVPLDGR